VKLNSKKESKKGLQLAHTKIGQPITKAKGMQKMAQIKLSNFAENGTNYAAT
jgi:hypothetical protein